MPIETRIKCSNCNIGISAQDIFYHQQEAIKSVYFERAYFYKIFPIVNTVCSQLNWSQGGDRGKN